MVADKVEVFSKKCTPGAKPYCWTSTGTGAYDINEASEVPRGSTIVMHLKDSAKEFAKAFKLKNILRKHSAFINFPIYMDDAQVNMVQAIWAKDKSECTEEDYVSFYKFISNAFDEPTYTLHYRADAPIEMKTLLFFPSSHMEKYGMARLEPAVSLYSRKVLIESGSPDILPGLLTHPPTHAFTLTTHHHPHPHHPYPHPRHPRLLHPHPLITLALITLTLTLTLFTLTQIIPHHPHHPQPFFQTGSGS
jgi:HSP90 family molecular chaperone